MMDELNVKEDSVPEEHNNEEFMSTAKYSVTKPVHFL